MEKRYKVKEFARMTKVNTGPDAPLLRPDWAARAERPD